MKATKAMGPQATAETTLWRCGGVTCPPGTCDHDDDMLRDASGTAPAVVPAVVGEVLGSSGVPLPPSVRRDSESRLGHDFADVRVHTDARAAESAQQVAAHAYTVGNHVVFGPGKYVPTTAPGLELLLHELVHTVQQRGHGKGGGDDLRGISDPGDTAETEAAHVAREAVQRA